MRWWSGAGLQDPGPGAWAQFKAAGSFAGSTDDRSSGFIRCSTRAQVAATATRVFRQEPALVVVAVETEALGQASDGRPPLPRRRRDVQGRLLSPAAGAQFPILLRQRRPVSTHPGLNVLGKPDLCLPQVSDGPREVAAAGDLIGPLAADTAELNPYFVSIHGVESRLSHW
ncbi:DUF952 domain-containing protein [Krasilnikovia sp. M28-CT-15]|uniref:DUF952 domain-containing protein n=1 Tax=Krasilnikovia sp. M28-CT-15 TaxID=3373540 RepID=UPI00399C9AA8